MLLTPTPAVLTIGFAFPWEDRRVAKHESIGKRLRRLRVDRGLSQRELSSPGVSYAYISRIEAGARTPSVKALRQLARKLGVTVEHLETGEPTPIERGVADAGLEFASLTDQELQAIGGCSPDSRHRVGRHGLRLVRAAFDGPTQVNDTT